ncbi:hypothetical protein B296_00045660 [Ensete ventricosum]|uniref:Uncharacterized protein n=1 Tax=Ensete ventricosum TaxID=4639 RepID=A0A426WWI7_ENSVE|nr:hypothetical protein B296_00045660 [Ensete ventricosum]
MMTVPSQCEDSHLKPCTFELARSLLGTELKLGRMDGDSELGSGSRLLEWCKSLYSGCCRSSVPGNPVALVAYLVVVRFHHARCPCGRLYDYWGIGLTCVRSVVRPLGIRPYMCQVSRFGGRSPVSFAPTHRGVPEVVENLSQPGSAQLVALPCRLLGRVPRSRDYPDSGLFHGVLSPLQESGRLLPYRSGRFLSQRGTFQ